MNIASQLPDPLNQFVLDIPANQYYDFELPPDSTYPLKGVTYPVDYGHIPGYTTEDNHELDLFVGTQPDGETGYVIIDRGETMPNEHKFYVALTDEEAEEVTKQLEPVLVEHKTLNGLPDLLEAIKKFKDQS